MSYQRFNKGGRVAKSPFSAKSVQKSLNLYTYNANHFELFEVAGRTVHLRQKVYLYGNLLMAVVRIWHHVFGRSSLGGLSMAFSMAFFPRSFSKILLLSQFLVSWSNVLIQKPL